MVLNDLIVLNEPLSLKKKRGGEGRAGKERKRKGEERKEVGREGRREVCLKGWFLWQPALGIYSKPQAHPSDLVHKGSQEKAYPS